MNRMIRVVLGAALLLLLAGASFAQTAPVVADIPGQTIAEGSTFVTISLDDYVSDAEDADSALSWSYTGNTDLLVSIDADRVATIGIPDVDWYGSETITFIATDSSLLSDSDPATFEVTAVNDAPVVGDIPGQTVAEGSTFTTVDLNLYVTDVDGTVAWTYSGNDELSVNIAAGVATITIPDID